MQSLSAAPSMAPAAPRGLVLRLNTDWHKPALISFMVIVLAHWAEHLAQAVQIYALGWPIPESRGVLGLWFPWLVKSEVMHFTYAVLMFIGLVILRPGFRGKARGWWTASMVRLPLSPA